MRLAPALVALLLLPAPALHAWGRKGHRIVAGLALQDLPQGPRAWFEGQEAYVLDHSSDPDRWKQDPLEGPRHFLEADRYGDHVPTLVSEAREKLGPAAFQRAGQLPWVIQDRVKDLAQAFIKGDRAQVAFLASILSHYVGDLHVPLHTVINYDGQESRQRGVHSRWETGLVDRLTDPGPEVRPAALTPNLFQACWSWLDESHALAAGVLRDDRVADPGATGKAPKPETYWLRFAHDQGPVVREQLARAGQRTAQLILLAWTLAKSPEAPRP
ncbi:MAG TPA: S1/P1 nuclease [Holophaga sp.]|nr:S1/P1 nuclease [Holophaga sp.]